MTRKPTRLELAREWRAKADAHKKGRLEEVRRQAPYLTGNLEAVFGRVILPGEHMGIAAYGSSDHVTGVEESQRLVRGRGPWEED